MYNSLGVKKNNSAIMTIVVECLMVIVRSVLGVEALVILGFELGLFRFAALEVKVHHHRKGNTAR